VITQLPSEKHPPDTKSMNTTKQSSTKPHETCSGRPKAHGAALTKLPSHTCIQDITQLIHHWLPVNDSYSINAIGTRHLCPYCQICKEDQQHCLTCPHPTPTKLWIHATNVVGRKLVNYNKSMHRKIIRLIQEAIITWRSNTQLQVPAWLQPKFQSLFAHLSIIGWNKNIYILGHLSGAWQLRVILKLNDMFPDAVRHK
jgi:hypothetical protein